MSINGIDIASWQEGINIAKLTTTKFVIVKATEDTDYVNPYFDAWAASVVKNGKKLGCYHFARPGNMEAQAKYFLGKVKKYIGVATLWLDWEEDAIPLGPAKAKQFLDYVYKKTGVKAGIYMSKSVCNAYDWSAVKKAGYPLWVAQYPDYNPTGYLSPGKIWTDGSIFGSWGKSGWTIFQYTSVGEIKGYNGDLDLDCYIDGVTAWDELAKGSVIKTAVAKVTTPTSIIQETGKVDRMVSECIKICNDDSHGYSQVNRWNPDFDCSSLMWYCAHYAGYPVRMKDPRWTGSMIEVFTAAGFQKLAYKRSVLRKGDILLVHNDKRQHTEMYIGNDKLAGAHIAETGGVDGKAGDQTGNEISVGSFYDAGWQWILRPPADADGKSDAKKNINQIADEVIRGLWGNGDTRKKKLEKAGYDYDSVQAKVNEILLGPSIDDLAHQVIRGEWGNGNTRKKKLEAAGYDYNAVQKRVNEILS